ncbi:MAG: tetratricopeptide repeat protein [Nitrospinae bacterium]|nr:tetratricopeptide repeat protein [Nitrospinota bacterium]
MPKGEVQEILEFQASLKEAREKLSVLSNKKIFIISGDKYVRELVRGYFETLGFPSEQLRISGTPGDVIVNMKQDPDFVDMLICPIRKVESAVGGQTGLQLLSFVKDRLLETNSKKSIPVIFMDKAFDKQDVGGAVKAGATSLLLLPSNPAFFGNKIAAAFEKQMPVSPSNDDVSVLVLTGNKYREQGLFDQAISYYNKALALGGENVDILNEKAGAFLLKGDLESAIATYKRVVALEANFLRAYQGLGDAYSQLGNIGEAKKNYAKVLELEPQNVQVYNNLGNICQEEGDFSSAKAHFTKGIEVNPKYAKNYLGLAKNFELEEKHEDALRVYKNGIAENPSLTILHITAGNFCLKHNMNTHAEEIFGKAIGVNENHLHLYNRMGLALRRQGKYDMAIANYAKGLKLKADDPNLRYNLAKALFMKGEDEKSLEALFVAIKGDPSLLEAVKGDHEMTKLLERYPERFDAL